MIDLYISLDCHTEGVLSRIVYKVMKSITNQAVHSSDSMIAVLNVCQWRLLVSKQTVLDFWFRPILIYKKGEKLGKRINRNPYVTKEKE